MNTVMSDQETFDTVVAHLRKQGRKSQEDRQCLYRGPDGTKCAVGCLIPDSEYSPKLEMHSIINLEFSRRLPPSLEGLNLRLLRELQSVHDTWCVYQWEERFQAVAKHYGLVYHAKKP